MTQRFSNRWEDIFSVPNRYTHSVQNYFAGRNNEDVIMSIASIALSGH